ncbi:MAG: response regulator [Promethearchaeota archaeon]
MEKNKPTIMVVEDNSELLLNIKLILEDEGFEVITAQNGTLAIETLTNSETIPDIIISDIVMPGMNGYEFLKSLASIPEFSHIPFIFLTALSMPKDIQYAKDLGVDDFIIKPIEEEILIQIIKNKLEQKQLSMEIYKRFQNQIRISKKVQKQFAKDEDNKDICLIYAVWDDKLGPNIQQIYPLDNNLPVPINTVSTQLFHAANLIYGHETISESESLLLNLKNLHKNCYLFLDSYPAPNERHGRKIFMVAVIAPYINYMNSIRIREVFKVLSEDIKKSIKRGKKDFTLIKYWDRIVKVLF